LRHETNHAVFQTASIKHARYIFGQLTDRIDTLVRKYCWSLLFEIEERRREEEEEE
jgi:hypothetical protein